MKIRRIALIGAGAIGAYLIWSFERTAGITLTVVAEGTRAERLKRDGIIINGAHYPLRVQEPGRAGPQDLVFISTKYSALDEAIAMLPPLMGPDTLVLSLLNGVDSEDRVAQAVGAEHVVHSVIRIASQRTGAEVRFDPDRVIGLSFGLPDARAEEQWKLEALSALFAESRLRWQLSDDIVTDICSARQRKPVSPSPTANIHSMLLKRWKKRTMGCSIKKLQIFHIISQNELIHTILT